MCNSSENNPAPAGAGKGPPALPESAQQPMISEPPVIDLVKELNALGVALSVEQDSVRLMELILTKAMDLTSADAGTLYTLHGDSLSFQILHTRSLGLHKGGGSGQAVELPSIPLHGQDGKPNRRLVVACAVLDDATIHVKDAYNTRQYDFSGTREFDMRFGYRSRSFLTVPMKDHENQIIGVLQLINKQEEGGSEVGSFTSQDIGVVESLASQAAVSMTKQALIEGQRRLFDAFIQLIATAIDQKSPYTGGHCRRVPELTNMLARGARRIQVGPLRDFDMSEQELYELEVAGWLHDCGKITIPEYVVDKATKLETIHDRLETVETRLEVLRRDAVIAALARRLGLDDHEAALADDEALQGRLRDLEDYRQLLRKSNIGGESMAPADLERIAALANEGWRRADGGEETLLSEDEKYNLMIEKGTLTPEERQIINGHMQTTIDMLESLPYPRHLRRVPEYAGGHHEKMDGSGFPKGLRREQMSLPARMMAIADIFEALTAADRPYKKAMPLSQALVILGRMKLNNHIDPDLFDVFIHEKVYLEYARAFLKEEQIDEVDVTKLPGYAPIS